MEDQEGKIILLVKYLFLAGIESLLDFQFYHSPEPRHQSSFLKLEQVRVMGPAQAVLCYLMKLLHKELWAWGYDTSAAHAGQLQPSSTLKGQSRALSPEKLALFWGWHYYLSIVLTLVWILKSRAGLSAASLQRGEGYAEQSGVPQKDGKNSLGNFIWNWVSEGSKIAEQEPHDTGTSCGRTHRQSVKIHPLLAGARPRWRHRDTKTWEGSREQRLAQILQAAFKPWLPQWVNMLAMCWEMAPNKVWHWRPEGEEAAGKTGKGQVQWGSVFAAISFGLPVLESETSRSCWIRCHLI